MNCKLPYYLFISFLILVVFHPELFSQYTFQKSIGGEETDAATAVERLSNDNIIIGGNTESFGNSGQDIFLLKLDECGSVIGTNKFTGISHDECRHIRSLSDGGFIITGYTESYGSGGKDALFIKMDIDANLQWAKTYGGAADELTYNMIETADAFYLSGSTRSYGAGLTDFYLVKTDKSGNLKWSNIYGAYNHDSEHALIESNDGNILVSGASYSYGNVYHIILMKVDTVGQMLWFNTYYGPDLESAEDIIPANDNGYIIVGITESFGAGYKDFFAMKVDENGQEVWSKTYGGSGADCANSIKSLNNNQYIISGYTESFGFGGRDLYVVNIDNQGNLNWSKCYGDLEKDGAQHYGPRDLIAITNNGFIIADYTESFDAKNGDIFIVKADENGNIENCDTFDPPTIVQNPDFNFSTESPNITQGSNEYTVNTNTENIVLEAYNICGISVDLGNDTLVCASDSIEINAGSGYASYLWNTGSIDSLITINSSGIYWVEVTNPFGCNATDSIQIDLYPAPDINLGNDTLICEGDYLVLNAGGGYLSYLWSNGSMDSSIVVNSTGYYWVEVENEFGCIAIDSILVEIYPLAIEELDLGPDTIFCPGDNFVINAGSGYTFYQWQDGSSDSIFIADTAGVYYVYVENPCSFGSDTIVLEVYPQTNIDLGKDTSVCFGESILLNPGFGFSSYIWQDGSSNQYFYASQTGTYWVQVMDQNACTVYDTINLELIFPDPNIGNDTAICSGDSIVLNAAEGFVSYLWQNGSDDFSIVSNTEGLIWCEVIDTNGCVGGDSLYLDILFPPVAYLGNDTVFCVGDSLWLVASPWTNSVDYIWQNGSADSACLVWEEGDYWVMATNACGSSSDSVFVSVKVLPWIYIGNDTILAMNTEIELDAGSGFEDYVWSDGSDMQTLNISEGGSYWVNVFDGVCYNADTIYIEPIECELFIPIVFTPNGDGYNDYFYAEASKDIIDFDLAVFNRWGEQIWETQDKYGKWDGQNGASKADEGTYFWVLRYACLASPTRFEKKGSVTMLR